MCEQVLEIMDSQIRGINDPIRTFPQFVQSFPLQPDPFQDGRIGEKRVWTAGLRESTDEDLVPGFEKDQFDTIIQRLQLVQVAEKIAEKPAFADINTQGDLTHLSASLQAELSKLGKECRRQVVYAEKPQVFKTLNGV